MQSAMQPAMQSATPQEQLIQQALRGELGAFNQLVVQYQGLAYSVALRLLRDPGSAEDAVQESFLKAFRALESFRGGSFKSWLLRIVSNTCYDVLRSRQRRPTDSLDALPTGQEHAPSLIDAAADPAFHAERMELGTAIERAVQQLPFDQRLVVILCDIHGYSYEEIAETTEQPLGTVKSRISRGRTKLRRLLQQHPELLPAEFRPQRE